MHTVGLKDSPLCTCGEPESVKHYIEDCEQHVEIRKVDDKNVLYHWQ